MYHEGTIGLNEAINSTILAHYFVRTGEPGLGIDGGRIRGLLVTIGGRTMIEYKDAWILLPDKANKELMAIYTIILENYN